MTLLHHLFSVLKSGGTRPSEILPVHSGGYAPTIDLDLYYTHLRDDRPYVAAMRDVAADLGRHF